MLDRPRIVCYDDFAQSDLAIGEFPSNASFVLPPLPAGWGIFPTVEAAVQAIKIMYEEAAAPDWFVLLSGSDYPIKSSERIRHDLAICPYDANIDYELIDPSRLSPRLSRPFLIGP